MSTREEENQFWLKNDGSDIQIAFDDIRQRGCFFRNVLNWQLTVLVYEDGHQTFYDLIWALDRQTVHS